MRELAVDLVVVLADLRDRGAPPDHRHDALVVVFERLPRPALEVGEDVLGGASAALQRDGAELWERLSVFAGDVGDVPDRVDARRIGHREVGLDVDASTLTLRQPAVRSDCGGP